MIRRQLGGTMPSRARESSDKLSGSAGSDIFVFKGGFGGDTINDFAAGGDVLNSGTGYCDLAAALASATASGNNTIITIDASNSVLLQNVALANLHVELSHRVSEQHSRLKGPDEQLSSFWRKAEVDIHALDQRIHSLTAADPLDMPLLPNATRTVVVPTPPAELADHQLYGSLPPAPRLFARCDAVIAVASRLIWQKQILGRSTLHNIRYVHFGTCVVGGGGQRAFTVDS